jgi:uncharacterized protein YbjT (DUF2867 family)
MYVVTGATGHTGNVVAKALLAKGQEVRVVGRNVDLLKTLVAQGAEPFTADLTDTATATKAFAGATAVYVMMPPNIASPDFRAFQNRVTDAIVAAFATLA